MSHSDPARDRKAETRPCPIAQRHEAVENRLRIGGSDTGTVIGDPDRRGVLGHLQPDDDPTCSMPDRVVEQVVDRLVQGIGVDLSPHVSRRLELEDEPGSARSVPLHEAIAAALAALVPPGGSVGVEALTYPVIKGTAERLGIRLVPLRLEAGGLTEGAVREAHRTERFKAVYLQPTLHNPLGITLSVRARERLAETLVELDLVAVEDAIFTFLAPDAPPPLAAFAPEHVILVDSFSKRYAPGLTVGLIASPPRLRSPVARAIRTGGWSPSGLPLAFCTRLVEGGALATIEHAKRHDAAQRQQLAIETLGDVQVQADPRSYHCWWHLPKPWRADIFIAAAAREGIAVTPGAAFAVQPGAAADAVRLALSSPRLDVLTHALHRLAAITQDAPSAFAVE